MLQCASDVFFGEARGVERKGLTIDDTTLQYCPHKIPELFPNSEAPATYLRLFRSWNVGWKKSHRHHAWKMFSDVVKRNGVKVLMAAPITCDKADDEQAWQWTKQLVQKLGPEYVMGFAVGNELELLYTQAPQACVQELWDEGRLWNTFQKRVAEIDEMGYGDIPITSVFTGGVAYMGYPFTNLPQARVNDFLANATQKYGYRYAFTFNIYPYFDHNLQMDPDGNGTCLAAMARALCWDSPKCLAIEAMVRARERMEAMTGRPDSRFWIGEIGWSSPATDALDTRMRECAAFSSVDALSAFYGGFLQWNLSIGSLLPPDHVFYFTLRDALNFGHQEHFGLMTSCELADCKVTSPNWTTPLQVYKFGIVWAMWSGGSILAMLLLLSIIIWVLVRAGLPSHRGPYAKEILEDNAEDSDSDSDRS